MISLVLLAHTLSSNQVLLLSVNSNPDVVVLSVLKWWFVISGEENLLQQL